MRAFWILLALIPGVPAILMGRLMGGALLLVIGAAGWNLGLYARFLLEEEDFGRFSDLGVANVEIAGFALGLLAILVSLVWTARLTSVRLAERRRRGTDAALAAAHDAYLHGKLAEALGAVGDGLRHDRRDVDLLFLEWQISSEAGFSRRAGRAKRRLRRADLDEKWVWEIEREEAVGGRG